jgi:hypothetical protein
MKTLKKIGFVLMVIAVMALMHFILFGSAWADWVQGLVK